MKAKINGLKLSYEINGIGLPVVLLHAFPLHRKMWQPQIEKLSRHFQIITPDFRGFGDSGGTNEPYLMDTLADDIHGLLSHLGLDKIVLCGLSMGGYVAFAFYRKYAAMVQGVILANTRAEADNEEAKKNRKALADLVIQEGPLAVAEQMPPKLLGKTSQAQKPELTSHVKQMIAASSIQGIANASLGMAFRPDSNSTLSTISCPTLILVGDEDTLTPVEMAKNMQRQIKNSELHIIAKAGHLSNLEQPGKFNNHLINFLKKL